MSRKHQPKKGYAKWQAERARKERALATDAVRLLRQEESWRRLTQLQAESFLEVVSRPSRVLGLAEEVLLPASAPPPEEDA